MASPVPVGAKLVLAAADFPQLLVALDRLGYQAVGPTLRDGQLIYADLTGVADLPAGWTDEQEPGVFRLQPRDDQALFGYGVGQQSWKQFLFPSHHLLWSAERRGDGFEIIPPTEVTPRYAFIGVHACDLHAMAIQDRVFLQGKHLDPVYQARREQAFILAVNCGGRGSGTCFCVSMGSGPRATSGFDLALTEVLQEGKHYFLLEVGSERGAAALQSVPQRPAAAAEIEAAAGVVAARAASMGRELDTQGLKELLYRNYEHPRWDEVAARCLNCGNCTWVCPTCFCHTIEDVTDLTGAKAERWRRQDVCFTVDYSYLHGGSIRSSPRSRYRQWLTHKLATWLDQFGCSGCVGCGRCLTWCPVGIDLTEEVRAIRENDAPLKETEHGDH
ncbi:MAG: 4Fe-4S dicluster domain-containing protein [Deltaproteobacteria bacterium]|nr:4Fe-4S dicluster domain-containing protein [Deltaproteobacteria bacterium]